MITRLKETGEYSVTYTFEGPDGYNEAAQTTYATEAEAFYAAAKLVVFSDCTDVSNVRVHHAGRTYRYAGWQPRMLVEFVSEFGVTVWGQYFPQWDH